jgi:hypothetical protein
MGTKLSALFVVSINMGCGPGRESSANSQDAFIPRRGWMTPLLPLFGRSYLSFPTNHVRAGVVGGLSLLAET